MLDYHNQPIRTYRIYDRIELREALSRDGRVLPKGKKGIVKRYSTVLGAYYVVFDFDNPKTTPPFLVSWHEMKHVTEEFFVNRDSKVTWDSCDWNPLQSL